MLLADGYVRIDNRAESAQSIDVTNRSTADGVQLAQYPCNGTAAQSYRLAQQS